MILPILALLLDPCLTNEMTNTDFTTKHVLPNGSRNKPANTYFNNESMFEECFAKLDCQYLFYY